VAKETKRKRETALTIYFRVGTICQLEISQSPDGHTEMSSKSTSGKTITPAVLAVIQKSPHEVPGSSDSETPHCPTTKSLGKAIDDDCEPLSDDSEDSRRRKRPKKNVPTPKYPCPYCKLHFTREGDLRRHLTGSSAHPEFLRNAKHQYCPRC